MKLLISVRSMEEALTAAAHGADLIDLKEPHAGALGALPHAIVETIVRELRPRHPALRISATVGDLAGSTAALIAAVLDSVVRMAHCGVDDVKVGIAPDEPALLSALGALAQAGLPHGARVVPVLIADDGVPAALSALASRLPFAAVMLDTQDKSRGSLVTRRTAAELRAFVATVHREGRIAGLAGSLRLDDLAALQSSHCDFAGFRGAVCAGDRRGELDAGRLAALSHARRYSGWVPEASGTPVSKGASQARAVGR